MRDWEIATFGAAVVLGAAVGMITFAVVDATGRDLQDALLAGYLAISSGIVGGAGTVWLQQKSRRQERKEQAEAVRYAVLAEVAFIETAVRIQKEGLKISETADDLCSWILSLSKQVPEIRDANRFSIESVALHLPKMVWDITRRREHIRSSFNLLEERLRHCTAHGRDVMESMFLDDEYRMKTKNGITLILDMIIGATNELTAILTSDATVNRPSSK